MQGSLDMICQGQPQPPLSSADPFSTLRAYLRPVEAADDSRFFKATSLNGACPYSFCTRQTLAPLSDKQSGVSRTRTGSTSSNAHERQIVNKKKTNAFSFQMVPDLPPPYGAAAVGEQGRTRGFFAYELPLVYITLEMKYHSTFVARPVHTLTWIQTIR